MGLNIVKTLPTKELIDENIFYSEQFADVFNNANSKLIIAVGINPVDFHVTICANPSVTKEGLIKALEQTILKLKEV